MELMSIALCFLLLVEVFERSSPPAPVEILPSNAGQDIAPTQSAGKITKMFYFFLFFKFCSFFLCKFLCKVPPGFKLVIY